MAIEARGYRFVRNPDPNSGGTSIDAGAKVIVISQADWNGPPERAVQAIAHEVGHATDPDPNAFSPIENPEWRNHSQYVEGNVDHLIQTEVTAEFFNGKVRAEILANGGTDIGINGSDAAVETYKLYANGHITYEQARSLLAEDWKASHPSTHPNTTYEQQDRAKAESSDDRTREPEPPAQPPSTATPTPSPGPAASPPPR